MIYSCKFISCKYKFSSNIIFVHTFKLSMTWVKKCEIRNARKVRVLLRKVGFKLLSFLIWETCFIFDFSLTTCCFTSSGGLALLPSTSLTRPGFSDQPHYRRTDSKSLVEDQTSGNQISWFQRQIWSVAALLATSAVDCKPIVYNRTIV